MCVTRKQLNEVVHDYRSYKALKEETISKMEQINPIIIDFLQETEECKTTNKSGKPILQYIGSDYKATYEERSKETANKDEVIKLLEMLKTTLDKENYQKVLNMALINRSTYNILSIR